MLKRPVFIILLVMVAGVGLWLYFQYRVPPGIEPMGNETETVALISLVTSVVAMITALVGLAQKWLELRATQKSADE